MQNSSRPAYPSPPRQTAPATRAKPFRIIPGSAYCALWRILHKAQEKSSLTYAHQKTSASLGFLEMFKCVENYLLAGVGLFSRVARPAANAATVSPTSHPHATEDSPCEAPNQTATQVAMPPRRLTTMMARSLP